MQKLKLKMISAAMALIVLSPFSYAAGLGKLKVSSNLGEPLIAEIELLSTTPEELANLTAEIASSAAYEAQNIERTSAASLVRVQAGRRGDGTPVLKLSSSQPISDPFLDMLVQVEWSSGRILREYTILLDPPAEIAIAPKPRITLPELNNSNVVKQYGNTATVVTPAPEKKSSKRSKKIKSDKERLAAARAEAATADKPAEQPTAKANNVVNTPTNEITTRRGDTLGKIARENMQQGVNLDQMLIALYRANKDAFTGGNINRLKVGQIIRVPTQSDIEATPKKEAHTAVIAQTQDWNAYRNNLAGVVADTPAKADRSDSQASAGKITTAVDQAAKPVVPAQDVVKLSKNDTSVKNSNPSSSRSAAAKSEDNIAAINALNDTQTKMQMLEKNIQDLKALKELTELKEKKLAEQQNAAKLAEAQKMAADAKQANSAKPTEVSKSSDSVMPVPVVTPAEASKLVEATKKEMVKPADVVKPQTAMVVVNDNASSSSGIFPSIINNENFPLFAAAAGLVALLGTGWLLMRNKRKKNITGFEQSILTGGGLKGNTVFGNTGGATVDTGDTSFLMDFTNSPGGIIDTNEVDPIAEAEVYMAYGRENQAEEILKDAIIKEPTRYELHLRLLEILSSRNDSSAFEAIAGELYTALGTDDPVWKKVAAMGSIMEPNNPLYQTTVPQSASPFSSTAKDLKVSDFDKTQVLTANNLDFTLDDDIVQASTENSLDFDLGGDNLMNEPMSDNLDPEQAVGNETYFSNDAVADLDLSFDMPDKNLSEPSSVSEANMSVEQSGLSESLKGDTFANSDMRFTMPEIEPDINTSEDISQFNTRFENVDNAIDFDFDGIKSTENFASVENDITSSLPSLDSNFSDISFDLDNDPAEVLDNIEIEAPEVNTKLDLVAAYIEMGDKEGAKELLDEVLKEGGLKQRAMAQALLNELT